MRSKSSNISLIIPIYQPKHGWEAILLDRYNAFCDVIQSDVTLIVVNDGSSYDLSKDFEHLKNILGAHVHIISYLTNRGKGGALKAGAAVSITPMAMFTDIDLPYTIDSMVAVYNALHTHGGIVAGHRHEGYYDDLSNFRTQLSKTLRKVNKFVLGLPINDTQCGLKAFDERSKDILLNCETERFLIDLEFLLAAHNDGVKITPVDVQLRPDIIFTKFNPAVLLKELVNFTKLLWRYRVIKR
jgi:glycosyltransferase involved in cell wall biosynthesis